MTAREPEELQRRLDQLGQQWARQRDELVGQAVATLEEKGCQVVVHREAGVLRARIVESVRSGGVVALSDGAALQRLGLRQALLEERIRLVEFVNTGPFSCSLRATLLEAGTGITAATAVVAETGSVVLAEDTGVDRLISNFPPRHIVVTDTGKIIPSLADVPLVVRAYAGLRLRKPLPRYVSMISGPSRTADIEFTLIKGMHGPGEVQVFLWDQPAPVWEW